jgi:hypothetical protein
VSGDRSSVLRKRALRRLSHEQHAAYAVLYEQVLAEIPGLTRHHARGRAWTRLRREFPDRYLELFALEHGGIGDDVPPGVRSRSWRYLSEVGARSSRNMARMGTAPSRSPRASASQACE